MTNGTNPAEHQALMRRVASFPLTAILFEAWSYGALAMGTATRVMDVGCGTSTSSAHLLRLALPAVQRLMGCPQTAPAELWMLDKNLSWLEIVEDEVYKELGDGAAPVAMIHADLTNMHSAKIVNTVYPVPGAVQDLEGLGNLLGRTQCDLLLLHSDMLGWFPFFDTSPGEVALGLKHLIHDEGRMLLTRLKGQPVRSMTPFLGHWKPECSLIVTSGGEDRPIELSLLGSSSPSPLLGQSSAQWMNQEIYAGMDDVIDHFNAVKDVLLSAIWLSPA